MIRRAAAWGAFTLCALALAGCIPDRPWPDATIDPATREQDAIDSLRAAGRWDDALARAEHRRDAIARSPGVPRWRRDDAVREAATLRFIVAQPESARTALASAERIELEARRLAGHDSLAAAGPMLLGVWRTHARVLGADHVETLVAATTLARLEYWAGHWTFSDSLVLAVVPRLRDSLGPDHPAVADAEELLGMHLKNIPELGGRRVAVIHHDRALHAILATQGPRSARAADVYEDLANVARLDPLARTPVTAALLAQAIGIRRSVPEARADDIASALTTLGILYSQDERWSDAEQSFREAVNLRRGERHDGRPLGYAMALASHGMALRHLGRLQPALAELSEAAGLRESLWVRAGNDEGRARVFNLMTYRELAVSLALAGRGDEAFEAFERSNARLLTEHLLGEQARDGSLWRGLLPRVQRSIPEDAALMGWIRSPMKLRLGGSPVLAYVLRAHGPVRWHVLHLALRGGPVLRSSRDRVGIELRASAEWPVRPADDTHVRQFASEMAGEWFTPLEADLHGVTQIVVAQPEYLADLPLEALRDSAGHWLDERFRISYAPSAMLYARSRERPREPRPFATRPALLVGDPSRVAGGGWPALAGTRTEIETIARDFPAATVLTGANASAARLRALSTSGALGRFGLLHFATHSDIDTRRPRQSALLLAQSAGGDSLQDRLSAGEISGDWRLDADLVSLASCRSSRGVITPADGDLGLGQAFLGAGARSLLVSLWPVDDSATSLFMRHFYEVLTRPGEPCSRSEALRQSRAWLRDWRDASGARPFAHPCYWAAFVLVGDPG